MSTETLTVDDLAFLAQLQEQLLGQDTDRRLDPRYDLNLSINVSAADTSRASEQAITGSTVDISHFGLKVELPAPPRIGDHYRLEMLVPKSSGMDSIMVFGRCVRAALVSDQLFEAAFTFLVPLADTELPLDSL